MTKEDLLTLEGNIQNYVPVTDAMLANPNPNDWLMIRGNYQSHSHSKLNQVNARNVKLRVPRSRVTDVARDILASCRVHDINVSDPPIEEVIRQVFAEK